MKKIILVCSLLAAAMMSAILIITLGRHQENKMKVYTILKEYSYWYQKEKKMSFDIYLDEEDEYLVLPNESQFRLKTKSASFNLNQVNVEKEWNCMDMDKNIYRYHITADLLENKEEDIHLKDVHLIIENNLYVIDCLIGNISIYQENYSELMFRDLYGQYAMIDGELMMVGVTICLDTSATFLNEVRIGNAYANLEYIEKDILKDSEISEMDLSHPILQEYVVHPPYLLDARYHYYFIPISYEEKRLITNAALCFKLDGNYYMIDNFSYYVTTVLLKNYPNSRKEGTITYA